MTLLFANFPLNQRPALRSHSGMIHLPLRLFDYLPIIIAYGFASDNRRTLTVEVKFETRYLCGSDAGASRGCPGGFAYRMYKYSARYLADW